MIHVYKPNCIKENDKLLVSYKIMEGEVEKNTVFSFDLKWENYLSIDVGDGILIMLLPYAIKNNHDIFMDIPVSEQLLYQIKNYVLVGFSKSNPEIRKIDITAQIAVTTVFGSEDKRKNAMGMSCGVDSFFTFWYHNYSDMCSYDDKIDLLTFYDVGAFNYDDGKRIFDKITDGSKQRELFDSQLENVMDLAKEIGIDLLVVKSNFAELFQMSHGLSHTYRNCGVTLLFQKLIKRYYYSSATFIDSFKFNFNTDPAYYETYLIHNLDTEHTLFYSFHNSFGRYEKIKSIKDFKYAQKYLNVCTVSACNCGICNKCSRTQLELMGVGALDKFSDVFDLERFNKKKNMQIGYAYASRKDRFYGDIIPDLKNKHLIGIKARMWAVVFLLFKPVESAMRKLPADKKRKLISTAEKFNLRVPF